MNNLSTVPDNTSDTFDSPLNQVSKSEPALTSTFDTSDTFDSHPPKEVSKLETIARQKQNFYTGDQLQRTVFPEVRWAIPGLISEGLTMLAGASKAGKSWLALGLAFDIASGLPVLGGIETDPGPVLYAALEDSGRRLQSRLKMISAGRDVPEDLTALTELPRMPEAVRLLDEHLELNPDLRLVIVDVFQKIRPQGHGTRNQYAEDYDVGTELKRLADHHNIPIVLVHHLRKMSDAEDVFNELSGSTGILGVADTIIVLKRPRNSTEGTLHVTGRDTPEGEYALEFSADTGRWNLTGQSLADASQAAIQRNLEGRLGDRSLQLLKAVEEYPSGVSPAQLSQDFPDLEMSNQVIGDYLRRLEKDGRLRKVGRGVYAPNYVSTPPLETTVESVETVEIAGQTVFPVSTVPKLSVESVETRPVTVENPLNTYCHPCGWIGGPNATRCPKCKQPVTHN